jgi:general secretion pathway protein J
MQNDRLHGYTLVEVLIALSIFVIIIAIISSSFIQILKNVDSTKHHEERLADIQSMLMILQFDLSQAIAKTEKQKNINAPQGSFYTKNDKLHFCKMGNVNPYYEFNRSTLENVQYSIENGRFIRNFKNTEELNYKSQNLLNDVESVKWIFYDSKLNQYNIWPPIRDFEYKTPSAIKITIMIKNFGQIEKYIAMANNEQ